MGVKKKREVQVAALTVCHQDLETLRSFADVEGTNLASLLLHCVQLTDGVSQIHSVKQIVPLLEKVDKNGVNDPATQSCLDILAGIYFSLTLKNPLKKVLASSLNGLPEFFLTEATHSFTSHLQEELNTADLHSYRKVIDNISSCMENFNLGRSSVVNLLENVLQFLHKSLIEILEENRKFAGNHIVQTQLMNDLLVGIRVSMTLVQKVQGLQGDLWNDPGSPIWQTMCSLLNLFTKCLNDDDLLQTIQSTSGLAVILFVKTMFRPSEKLPGLISSLLLQSVDCTSIPEWFRNSCRSLCCADLPASTLLFLCQGTLAMLDWQDRSMDPSGEALLLDTGRVLFTLSSQIKESTLEMFLSRILASWTNSAIQILESSSPSLKASLNGDSSIARRLLEYVYTHWEHPLDALRHQTKIIFRNLLQMHRLTMGGADAVTEPFFLELTKSLLQLEWHIKGKYACLGCLVECIGVEHILSVDRTIPSQILEVMGDQSLVPYASDLLETMFKNHKSHLKFQTVTNTWMDEWHETWVSPLLSILCGGNLDQKSYVIDYYLPRLLNYSPESLQYMVKILQASIDTETGFCNRRGALGALMACLRTARAHGHLQSATHAWEDLVCGARIKQGLIHQHCQVRIDTLGLLCESNRSTEVVSTEEMQWAQFFITYNLNSQSPGVRQQMCSLLKKLFCRVQESSQVLYKLEQRKSAPDSENGSSSERPTVSLQQYKNFMSSVCNILFEALFPGSSYSTRFSALSILGSIADVFAVSEGNIQTVYQLSHDIDAGRFQILLECFTSTFEEVKTLAFDLLMKLSSVTARQFQDAEKLQGLFQAALELSTSTKPYDCVTASYLLNLLIWQDALPVSLTASQAQQLTHGTAEKVAVLERNTLVVIKCLMEHLEDEISQAEDSLLQAASSFPMYGRVHCITRAFQKLPLNDLQLVSEWRQVVEKLLLLSYRLSAVVSPVIQSSSPEGLIPMDTDSESASRLQGILNEIQPRDTNAYFNQAKILKECDSFDLEDLRTSVSNIDSSAEIKGKEAKTCDVTAQMVLVCCWRSMKEVALLLGTLCQLLPIRPVPEPCNGLLTVQQPGNANVCLFVPFRCSAVSLQKLPEQWLWSVLEEIKSSDPSSKLCATRRSAGIPFYIQALLASEPKKGKMDLLKITMKELISLALSVDASTGTVPQVHALNILRALFRDTRLGENIIPYIADGAKAAILGFTSPVWAVRNSSTLLFSSLITRIFGVKRGKDELSKTNRNHYTQDSDMLLLCHLFATKPRLWLYQGLIPIIHVMTHSCLLRRSLGSVCALSLLVTTLARSIFPPPLHKHPGNWLVPVCQVYASRALAPCRLHHYIIVIHYIVLYCTTYYTYYKNETSLEWRLCVSRSVCSEVFKDSSPVLLKAHVTAVCCYASNRGTTGHGSVVPVVFKRFFRSEEKAFLSDHIVVVVTVVSSWLLCVSLVNTPWGFCVPPEQYDRGVAAVESRALLYSSSTLWTTCLLFCSGFPVLGGSLIFGSSEMTEINNCLLSTVLNRSCLHRDAWEESSTVPKSCPLHMETPKKWTLLKLQIKNSLSLAPGPPVASTEFHRGIETETPPPAP
ncbi:Thada [Phodopus roborovskii]|uniref:tRNA (32-2'-O)-methyltransferase regulator THADA n=1 Tax=Phodopus roborovskii TaxID=109678 RepID=A0AAU9YTP5_PHORO|nr:Thada [Phodopus roborovskii]